MHVLQFLTCYANSCMHLRRDQYKRSFCSDRRHFCFPTMKALLLIVCCFAWTIAGSTSSAQYDQFIQHDQTHHRLQKLSWADEMKKICGCKRMPSSFVPGKDATHLDLALAQFSSNLEALEAEFFLYGALGYGLSKVNPTVAVGPEPIGGQRANLDPLVRDVIAQFAFQEVGHLRAIRDSLKVKSLEKPQLDLSINVWAKTMDKAVGEKLEPPFNPYANSINYMLACYMIPYVGANAYVAANPLLTGSSAKRLVAGLLGVEAGQDAIIRAYLYTKRDMKVEPYRYTVAEMTAKLSGFRSMIDRTPELNDEGIVVPKELGAEEVISGNIIAGDSYSLTYSRTPDQVLGIVYGNGRPDCPGGFYPSGAVGVIAHSFKKIHHSECPPP